MRRRWEGRRGHEKVREGLGRGMKGHSR